MIFWPYLSFKTVRQKLLKGFYRTKISKNKARISSSYISKYKNDSDKKDNHMLNNISDTESN